MRKSIITATVVGLVALGLGVPPAAADEPHQTTWVYRSTDPCVRDRVQLIHGDYDWGGISANTQAWRAMLPPIPPFECFLTKFEPVNYIAGQMVWQKWMPDGSGVWDWRTCDTSGWLYNRTRTYYLATDIDYPRAWCGEGDYYAWNGSYVYANGDWRGGWLGSGRWHHFPFHHKESIMPAPTAPTTAPGGPPPGPPPAEPVPLPPGATTEVRDGLTVTVITR